MAERDWTQPPTADAVENLSAALHDATLVGIVSDRLTRTLALSVELGFPEPPEPCPEAVEITFQGATHAFVFVYRNWPGPPPRVVTPITPAMEAASEAYKRRGRAETIGLDELIRRFADDTTIEVMGGSLRRSAEGLTLALDGYADDGSLGNWVEMRIGAESLDVTLPDGSPLGLTELVRLGGAGWTAWETRPRTP